MQRRIRLFLSVTLLVVGAVLLAVAAVGHFSSLGQYPNRAGEGLDRLDLELAQKTRDLSSLYAEAQKRAGGALSAMPPGRILFALHDTTCRRFSRGKGARHTFLTNWLIRSAGLVLHPALPEFGQIADPDLLLKYGHSAPCGQVSYVLVQLARLAGIPARHVGLKAHVVMEAWHDDEWHMYDPYYEVVAVASHGSALSVDQLARQPDRIDEAYQGREDTDTARRFFDRSVISYATQPPYVPWHWKGSVMLRVERAAEFLKFAIPVILILLGAFRLRSRPGSHARQDR